MQFLICGIVFCLGGASAIAAEPLTELRDGWRGTEATAMIAEDTTALASPYSDDVWIMPEYQQTAVGPDKARAYYDAYFQRFDIVGFEKIPGEVFEIADVTVEIGTFSIRQFLRDDGSAHDWTGTYFDVWQGDAADAALLSRSWNYDKAYEGARELAHFDDIGGIPAPNLPGVAVTDPLDYEIAALKTYGEWLMTSQQPGLLNLVYAEDGMYSPHDTPMVWGREAIRAHLAEYTANWPPFTFVDVETHRLIVGEFGILDYGSYNLRWIGEDETGVSMGKGLRIWKRSDEGQLQYFRQISMHDF